MQFKTHTDGSLSATVQADQKLGFKGLLLSLVPPALLVVLVLLYDRLPKTMTVLVVLGMVAMGVWCLSLSKLEKHSRSRNHSIYMKNNLIKIDGKSYKRDQAYRFSLNRNNKEQAQLMFRNDWDGDVAATGFMPLEQAKKLLNFLQ